jgi:hypothetical protein
MFPLIKVRDKSNGEIHIVGLDSHDELLIIDGQIMYHNLQNGDGTGEDGSYEFIAGKDGWDTIIKFVPLDELLNAYCAETQFSEEDAKMYKEAMAKVRESLERREKAQSDSGIVVMD